MIVIWTAVAVAFFLAHLVLHEGAHALALREYGIPIREAGLGMPFPPRIVLKPTRRRPFALSLSPWIVGASVVPVLSVAALGLVVYSFAGPITEPGGIVGWGRLLAVSSPLDALMAGVVIALVLAVFNIIPVYPLDGGRIAGMLVSRWFG